MPSSLEFHDSTLLDIERHGMSIRLRLDAYVHQWDMVDGRWTGSGWVQPVEIAIDESTMKQRPQLPVDLDGGVLEVGETYHTNLVPLPLIVSAHAMLRLELRAGEALEISGNRWSIQVTGPGERREDLPDEWAPAPK